MIEIKNVSCKIKNKIIINDISCKIEDTGLTAIIGPNGSGKSTLLKCITQLIKYKGEIQIDMHSSLKGFTLAKHLAYLSQTHTILFPHTVFDTVLMGRRPHAPYRYSQNDYDFVNRIIEEMGLSEFYKKPILNLSGGELQKTFFSRSLVQDTKYMLLDEPFNNLDPYYQVDIIKKLVELKNKKSIIVVLHDTFLLRYFDRVILLKKGQIINNVFTGELNCELLEELYDVSFIEYDKGENCFFMPVMQKQKI